MRRATRRPKRAAIEPKGPRLLELEDHPAPPEWRDLVEGCITVADAAVAGDPRALVMGQMNLRRRVTAWARAGFPLTY